MVVVVVVMQSMSVEFIGCVLGRFSVKSRDVMSYMNVFIQCANTRTNKNHRLRCTQTYIYILYTYVYIYTHTLARMPQDHLHDSMLVEFLSSNAQSRSVSQPHACIMSIMSNRIRHPKYPCLPQFCHVPCLPQFCHMQGSYPQSDADIALFQSRPQFD